MSHLRFFPREYRAICEVCLPLDLGRLRPRSLRRHLARSLDEPLPDLAGRIARLSHREADLLYAHLSALRQPQQPDLLSAAEIALLATACGPLLDRTRFVRPLKGALVQHFLPGRPELAAKLERLSHRQFESVCESVRGHLAADSDGEEDSCRN